MLGRWIEELARFLEIANPLMEHTTSDEVDSLFHSLLNCASALRRIVLLLDALDQTELTPRGQYLTWLKVGPWPPNVRLLATAVPSKAATVLSEAPGIQQIELPPLTQADAEAIVRQVWRRYHREVNSPVLGLLTQKTLGSSSQAAGNPLWLTLASEQLNLLDADDFSRAEQEFSGSPTERLKAFLAAVAVSRHGWRESDLQVLIPRLNTILENGADTPLPNCVHDAAMNRAVNRYDAEYTPSNPQEAFPAAELAAIKGHFVLV